MLQSDFWSYKKNTRTERKSGDEARVLQQQLGDMEGEVKEIQMELAAIKKNRLDLGKRKHATERDLPSEAVITDSMQDDNHEEKLHKLTEIYKLREELYKAKNAADEERFKREKYEEKLKDLELQLNNICSIGMNTETKESRKNYEDEVSVLKIQVRDLKEEAEELKITISENTEQLNEYRMKYIHAQQQVEELKRQLDIIEYDNKQVSDQIHIEIQKMKMQFQEKLQELASLPDLLKGAQIQLSEAKQLQSLAEDSSRQLSNELHRVKEKLVAAVNNLNQEKGDKMKLIEDNKILKASLDEKIKEIEELLKNVDDYKSGIMRLEEKLVHQDILYKEKSAEHSQLVKDFEELREESTRSLGRCKERSDSMRRFLQTQISELERQLIQSRAQCRSCQKERDDIRQKMQVQINSLHENFELVEIRLRNLQGQVTSLKSSYTVILTDDEDSSELNTNIITTTD